MDKQYTTEQKIAEYLNETISTSLIDYILFAQDYIDNYTGQNFKADCIASARVFSGNENQFLSIDECIEITKVEVGQDQYGDEFEEIPSTGTGRYYTLPENANAKGIPIDMVYLREYVWPEGIQNNRITAKWGYSEEAPSDISYVATLIASTAFKQGQNAISGTQSISANAYSISFQPSAGWEHFEKVKKILDKYKKYQI